MRDHCDFLHQRHGSRCYCKESISISHCSTPMATSYWEDLSFVRFITEHSQVTPGLPMLQGFIYLSICTITKLVNFNRIIAIYTLGS